jgi:LysM repeat protein
MRFNRILWTALNTLLLGSSLLFAASYTVQKGETLYQIAKSHDTSVEAIVRANPGLNPQRLHAGDIVQLPSAKTLTSPSSTPASTALSSPKPSSTKPEWVKIKKGDSLAKISRERGISIENLRKWNSLRSDILHPGDLLRIQPTTGTAAKTSPPKSKPVTLPPASATPKAPKLVFVPPVKAQIDSAKDDLRDWEYIVVHHSGTSGGNARIFDAYHKERGMENGMAYHFVIGNGSDSGDGQIEVGQRWIKQIQGGHLASESLNEIAIGICLVGDFSHHQPDPRQTAALIELVQTLRQLQPSPRLKFRLHREINTKPTECPGKLFPAASIHEILD